MLELPIEREDGSELGQPVSLRGGYHSMMDLVSWLITGAAGPALVALPVNWTARQLGNTVRRWLAKVRHADGLSRLVKAAGASVGLTDGEYAAVRRLLEAPQTWRLIGTGTVEDLAQEISKCLQTSDDPGGNPLLAARVIVRGLLEFAVFDLEPELFQRLLMARLARLETGQTAALDQAMLRLHADLAARSAQQSQDDEQWFRRIMTQLGQVLDRLPPGPAGGVEVALYLAALIRWLNSDPWPQDPRLGGPVLIPAAIERKLTLTSTGAHWNQDQDADELADRCTRLVVLGGPGSGKTWLARRAARRCADAALETLTTGRAGLEEVELPLFTTCSLLTASRGDIRRAAVSSALDQLGDLGTPRITAALRVFFSERNAPTLLVIDSLDEAHNPDARLRQADTLPWRIILTSRPSSWRQQLAVDGTDRLRQVGTLRPLSYPSDVEPFIDRWFTWEPARAQALRTQIAVRKDLQQAATIPLILAFYCIIAGGQPLPGTRREVYALVLRRLMVGLWRGGGDDLDLDACVSVLRDWAWSGAARDQVSGIGTWADEIPAPYVRIPEPDRDAVDRVASPQRPRDLDTGLTPRRFVHQSIREHLTAEHVAKRMTPSEAAEELLNHLWYDADWEYTAPAALAMHPGRDQVLRELICRVGRSARIRGNLADIDGCLELRRFLARAARESYEADWTAESTAIISRARLDLAREGLFAAVGPAPGWENSNRQIRQVLMKRLARATGPVEAKGLVEELAGLGPEPAELARARARILKLLDGAISPREVVVFAEALMGLGPELGELARARARTLELLDGATRLWDVTPVVALRGLTPEPGELSRARARILELLADTTRPWDVTQLTKTLVGLGPEAGELARARARILELLAGGTRPWDVPGMLELLAGLGPEPSELAQARERILKLLDGAAFLGDVASAAVALAGLGPESGELARACARILKLLADTSRPDHAALLAQALAALSPEPGELAQARARILELLLVDDVGSRGADELAQALAALSPKPGELAQARARILELLAGTTDPRDLAKRMARLSPEPGELAQVRGRILELLRPGAVSPWGAWQLVKLMTRLGPEPGELAQARGRILERLRAGAVGPQGAADLGRALAALSPEPSELALARARVMELLLADATLPREAAQLAKVMGGLEPEPGELACARARIVDLLLLGATLLQGADALEEALAGLGAVTGDLASWKSWTVRPYRDVLATARRNSALSEWLDFLPALAGYRSWLP